LEFLMPIYEYRCSSCGFQKEYLQKVTDPRLSDCPECGKTSLQKMLTAAGFQLKGSGWYATDFKSGAKPKDKAEPAKADAPAGAPAAGAGAAAAGAAAAGAGAGAGASASAASPAAETHG
jgi:putative FmdB family regulatory protein